MDRFYAYGDANCYLTATATNAYDRQTATITLTAPNSTPGK